MTEQANPNQQPTAVKTDAAPANAGADTGQKTPMSDDKRKNLIIVGAIIVIIGVIWYSSKSNTQQQPGRQEQGQQDPGTGPGSGTGTGGMTLEQYLVGTWTAQSSYGNGQTQLRADGSFTEYMQYEGVPQVVTTTGSWSVSQDVVTMRVHQSDMPQRIGGIESIRVSPISRNECRISGPRSQTFVMYRAG